MKAARRTATWLALVLVLVLGGCGSYESGKAKEGTDVMMPTEREVQIARDMAYPADQLERMEQEGLSAEEQGWLPQTVAAVEHAEGRYGLAFTAREVAKPDFADTRWFFSLEVAEGPHEGEEVRCTATVSDGEWTYEDTGLAILWGDELVASAREAVEASCGLPVVYDVVVSTLPVGGEVGKGATLADVAPLVGVDIDAYALGDAFSREDYDAQARALEQALGQRGHRFSYEMHRARGLGAGARYEDAVAQYNDGACDWQLIGGSSQSAFEEAS